MSRAARDTAVSTGASNGQKWAIGWSANDVLVLYSSDIGTYSYDIKDDGLRERSPEDDEIEVGRSSYERKYGKRPRS